MRPDFSMSANESLKLTQADFDYLVDACERVVNFFRDDFFREGYTYKPGDDKILDHKVLQRDAAIEAYKELIKRLPAAIQSPSELTQTDLKHLIDACTVAVGASYAGPWLNESGPWDLGENIIMSDVYKSL